jgi:hypothetical protein
MVRSIQYDAAPLNAFKVAETNLDGKVTVMSIDGRTVEPTPRFWTSLCSTYSRYGLSTKLFKLFTHQEVFQRVSDVVGSEGKDRLRFALEDLGAGNPRLLAVTNPNKALVQYDKMQQVLQRYGAQNPEYKDGIIRSTHAPAHMDDFQVGGDGFSHQYVMETPIDGFGKPLIYLSLLRQVCTNGMIGYARAFRTEINIGRGNQDDADSMFSIGRALDSFNNEEGYAALRQRFESAANSWASVYEVNRVLKVVNKMAQKGMFHDPSVQTAGVIDDLAFKRDAVLGAQFTAGLDNDAVEKNPANIKLMRAFTQMAGDLCSIYGIAHLDAVSTKKMQKIPARCTMYDLLNFTTEAATHYCDEKNGRLLQAEVGNFVSNEYDLEGTKETHEQFQDFFTDVDRDTDATT